MRKRRIAKRIAWSLGLAAIIYVGYGVVNLFLWNIQFSTGMAIYRRAEAVDHESPALLLGAAPFFQKALALDAHDSSSRSILGRIRIKEMLDHLREGRHLEGLKSAKEAEDYLAQAIRLSPAEAENRLSMGYLLMVLSRYRSVPSEVKRRYIDDALALAPSDSRILKELIALNRGQAHWIRAAELLRKFSALAVERNPKYLDFLRTDIPRQRMLDLTREFFMKTVENDPDIRKGTLTAREHPEPAGPPPASALPETSIAAISYQGTGKSSKSVFPDADEGSEEVKALLAAMADADSNRQMLLQERRQPVLRWFSRALANRNPFILEESLSEHERDAILKGIEDAIGREPACAPLFHIYAACAARTWSRWESALEHVQKAAKMLPHNPLIPEALGDLFREMGMTKRAMESYRRALALPGHSVSVYHRIGRMQLDGGDPAAAEQTFRKAMLMYPDHYAPYTWLGDYYYRYSRRYNLAVAMFQKARKIQSDNPLPYAGIAYSLEAMGQETDAVRYFLKAASHQRGSEMYRAEAARIYQKQGKYREAMGALKLALARRGGDPDALLQMGEIHLALKDYRSAAGYFERCLQRTPLHYWARLGAALAYEKIDRPIKAISLLEGAKALYPSHHQTYVQLARIYERMGEQEKSVKYLKMARKMAPEADDKIKFVDK